MILKSMKSKYRIIGSKITALILALLIILTAIPIDIVGYAYGAEDDAIEIQWRRTIVHMLGAGDIIDSCVPVVDNEGNVYITLKTGYLMCISKDERVIYISDIGGISAGPAVDDKGNAYAVNSKGYVYAFDSKGNSKWSSPYKMKNTASLGQVCTVGNNTVYAVDSIGYVYALDSDTGEELWTYKTALGKDWGSPVLSNDKKILYIAGQEYVAAYHAEKTPAGINQRKWLSDVDKGNIYFEMSGFVDVDRLPAVDEIGNVYVVSYQRIDGNMYLYKINGSDGRVLWEVHVSSDGTYAGAPVYTDGFIYLQMSDGRIIRADASTSENNPPELETFVSLDEKSNVHKTTYRVPMVKGDDNSLYAMTDENIYAIDKNANILRRSNLKSIGEANTYMSCIGPSGEIYINRNGKYLVKLRDKAFAKKPVSADAEDFVIAVGDSWEPSAVWYDDKGSIIADDVEYELSSDNSSILSVSNGSVKAVAEGRVKLSFKSGDVLAEATVTVVKSLESAKLNVFSPTGRTQLSPGSRMNLDYAISLNELPLRGRSVVWSTAHNKIASVSQDGYVTGISEGNAKIEARISEYPSITDYIAISVKKETLSEVSLEEIKEALRKSVDYIRGRSIINDWYAFILIGAGVNPLDVQPSYVERIKANITAANGVAGSQMTDYARTIIGLTAAGEDVTNFEYSIGKTVDLIKEMRNGAAGGISQGINAPVWGLTALNAARGEYYNPADYDDTAYTEDTLIKAILNQMCGNIDSSGFGEGWAFGSGTPDADMTGMALYALAPYKDRADVKAAGEKAIKWLSDNQLADGRFGSWGTVNSCSTAQALMGILSWGIDPAGPEFTKANGNLVTALWSYYLGDGTFMYQNSFDPGFGTPQSLQATVCLKDYYESSDVPENRRAASWESLGSKGSDQSEIKFIKIVPSNIMLAPGKQIELTVIDDKGRSVDSSKIQWSVDEETIASIDNGILKTIANGTAIVRAEYLRSDDVTIFGQINITVVNAEEYNVKEASNKIISGFGDNVREFIVTNNSSASVNAVFMANLYERNSMRLIRQVCIQQKFVQGDTRVAIAFDVPDDGNKYDIKIMLWDNLTNIRSLKPFIEIREVR